MNHSLFNPGPIGPRIGPSALGHPRWDVIATVDAAVRAVLIEQGTSRQPVAAEVFAERLLSLRHAEQLPRGVVEVRVAPGTVVTPLARDLLKSRGVALRWVARAEVDRTRRGEWGCAFEARSGQVAALRRTLLEGSDHWHELGSVDKALRWVHGAAGRAALIVTEDAAVTVWSACQMAGIRAAMAEDCGAIDRAVRRLGVNVLVVEPAGKSIASLRQMSLTFRRGGAPRIPEALVEGVRQ